MSHIYKELEYTSDIKRIIGVQFGVFSPEEIKRRSVVKITEPLAYDGTTGHPILQGLFDPRMGVIEVNKTCVTCDQKYTFCPGHFGHIELARPVYYTHFLTTTLKVLKCICFSCGRLLIHKKDPQLRAILKKTSNDNKKRFDELVSLASKYKKCGQIPDDKVDEDDDDNVGCGAIQPKKYSKSTDFDIFAEHDDKEEANKIDKKKNQSIRQYLTPEYVLRLFRRIPLEDCEILGFSPNWCMPSWLIATVIPVGPPALRPSVRQYNNQRSEDDLTHKYIDLIKYNNRLFEKLENEKTNDNVIKGLTDLIQYHVATLIDNDPPTGVQPATHRSNRQLKTFKQRLHGKEGRIRGNLMGKRVDFSARSVITADPNLKISELGIPQKIAMELSYPERVNKYNINEMYKLVRNGPHVYPGVKSVKKKNEGHLRLLEYADYKNIVLEEGDIVNRHLRDGDVVLFNRQPSLHKMSMMAHTARITAYNTFRMNPSVCTPYNADFDGDEMNLHVPQSASASIELEELAAVPFQIISPSKNNAIISFVQDTLLGYYAITDDAVLIDRRDIMNYLMKISSFNGILPPPKVVNGKQELWSGHQLISLVLPNINFDNGKVKIEDGQFIKGQITKDVSNTLIVIIYNDYGPKVAQDYLDDINNIVTRWLIKQGHSVGVSDLIINGNMRKDIRSIIDGGKKKILALERDIHLNIFSDVSKTANASYERETLNILKGITSEITKKYKSQIPKTNRVLMMSSAGSKGGDLNIQQMSTHLGQQIVQGKRVPIGYTERTLPHYYRYDNNPISRGFVENSFIDGLTPQESFFHAMGGREGLIDTAVKTSESGYIQRKLVKALEDLKVYHDATVRNSNGDIVQFLYGYDGVDASGKLEGNRIDLVTSDYATIRDTYRFSENEVWDFITPTAHKAMTNITDWRVLIEEHFADLMSRRDKLHEIFGYNQNENMEKLKCPFNIERIIKNTIQQFRINPAAQSDMNPIEVIDAITKLCKDIQLSGFPNLNFELVILSGLSPKKMLKKYRLNRLAFEYAVSMILYNIKHTMVQPGEMVGILAAQSLGEISTQLTLNTFHQAGSGSTAVTTQGVPRLRELLSNTKSMSTPSNTLALDENAKYSLEKVLEVKYNIEITTIRDIADSCSIYNDPDNKFKTVVNEDRNVLEIYKIFTGIDDNCREIKNNPWIMRFKFNRAKMMERKISMDNIYQVIIQSYSNCTCVFSDDNSSELIFRIRFDFTSNPEASDDDIKTMKKIENKILDLAIKGIDYIDKAHIDTNNINLVKDNVGNYVTKPARQLITDGSNLIELMTVNNVDYKRCSSNDVNEIYMLFGIEAARQVLMNEFRNIIGSINYRHVAMLCDAMTSQGMIMSVDRHGINRGTNGPLAKCSFEEAVDQLQKAAIYGDFDNLTGVSANVMMGQIPPCGTGDSVVILDELKLVQTQKDNVIENTKDVNIDSIITVSNYCQENVGIKFNVDKLPKRKLNLKKIPKVVAE